MNNILAKASEAHWLLVDVEKILKQMDQGIDLASSEGDEFIYAQYLAIKQLVSSIQKIVIDIKTANIKETDK